MTATYTRRFFRYKQRASPQQENWQDVFELDEEKLNEADVPDGHVVVEVDFLSAEPSQRNQMNEECDYSVPWTVGQAVPSLGSGKVVCSKSPLLSVGDAVTGRCGWQTYAAGPAEMFARIPDGIDPRTWLSIGGFYTAGTAIVGLKDIGQLKQGDTLLVSSAAGAIGSLVGQLGKLWGCSAVVGLAGSDAKCRHLLELGFTGAINYKRDDLVEAVEAACPNGIDVYFDNVGGRVLEAALEHMNVGGRIVMCGQIASYNSGEPTRQPGPNNLMKIVGKQLLMRGYIVSSFIDRFPECMAMIEEYIREGKVEATYTVLDGLEQAPSALARLFTGDKLGKILVRVSKL